MTEYAGKGVWCVADLAHGVLNPTVFELISAGRRLCRGAEDALSVIVIGGPGKASAAAGVVAARGADKVFVVEHAQLDAFADEAYSRVLKDLIDRDKPAKILLAASSMGRSLAARIAVLSRGSLISDVTELGLDGAGHMTATRPCFAGNLLAGMAARRGPEIATVRPMAFSRSESSGKTSEVVPVAVDPAGWGIRTRVVRFVPEESKEIDLSTAEKIVSGGRGLGNAKGFEMIRELAHLLGAAVGASRAVVDSGWIAYRHQVGLTGRTVRPKLYIACGISGQVQHMAGMSSSDVLVAINTDPDCPMMKVANFAVQGDLYQVIPAIIAEIKKQRGSR